MKLEKEELEKRQNKGKQKRILEKEEEEKILKIDFENNK